VGERAVSWVDRLLKREASLSISLTARSWTHFTVATNPGQKVVLDASFDVQSYIDVMDPLSFYAWMGGRRMQSLKRWRGLQIEGSWLPPRPDSWVFVVRGMDEALPVSGQIKMKLKK